MSTGAINQTFVVVGLLLIATASASLFRLGAFSLAKGSRVKLPTWAQWIVAVAGGAAIVFGAIGKGADAVIKVEDMLSHHPPAASTPAPEATK